MGGVFEHSKDGSNWYSTAAWHQTRTICKMRRHLQTEPIQHELETIGLLPRLIQNGAQQKHHFWLITCQRKKKNNIWYFFFPYFPPVCSLPHLRTKRWLLHSNSGTLASVSWRTHFFSTRGTKRRRGGGGEIKSLGTTLSLKYLSWSSYYNLLKIIYIRT